MRNINSYNIFILSLHYVILNLGIINLSVRLLSNFSMLYQSPLTSHGSHLISWAWTVKSYILYLFLLQIHTSQAFTPVHSSLKAPVSFTFLKSFHSFLSQSDSQVLQIRSSSNKYVSSVSCKNPCCQGQAYYLHL